MVADLSVELPVFGNGDEMNGIVKTRGGKAKLLVPTLGSKESVLAEIRSVLHPDFDLESYLKHLDKEDPFDDVVGGTAQCLSLNDFIAYFENRLSSKKRLRFEQHFNECTDCLSAVVWYVKCK